MFSYGYPYFSSYYRTYSDYAYPYYYDPGYYAAPSYATPAYLSTPAYVGTPDWSAVAEAAAPSAEYDEPFYAGAVAAFQRGDYQEASRLASHALIDNPRDAKVHELLSLAMFALGEYRVAAVEAHAAAALGPVADWPTLYAYYNNLDAYTKHLDALANDVQRNPSSTDARFLLAYHNIMMGHRSTAKQLLADVVAKVPQDQVAAKLLNQLQDPSQRPGNVGNR